METSEKTSKILEIGLDNGVIHTRYFVLNEEVGGYNSKFFESSVINNKKITALTHAKNWAKENGYTHLKVIALKINQQDKSYILNKP